MHGVSLERYPEINERETGGGGGEGRKEGEERMGERAKEGNGGKLGFEIGEKLAFFHCIPF